MGQAIRSFRDADGVQVQPYMAAYMIEHGFRTCAERKEVDRGNAAYLVWNRARWAEFNADHGISSALASSPFADDFLAWLEARTTRITAVLVSDDRRIPLAA